MHDLRNVMDESKYYIYYGQLTIGNIIECKKSIIRTYEAFQWIHAIGASEE